MIVVESLTFDYDTKRALTDVGFTIEAGTITAMVGPNGAGKTTLLRCIAGLARPVAGRVRIDGIDVHDQPQAAHARTGFLQDFFGLYDTLTVEQCLHYAALARAVPADAVPERVAATARRLGLTDRLRQRAGSLSRGWRQRLGVAQALIHRPPLLILDEPASGLDPEARFALSELLVALRGEGMTLIVSSHILTELQDYSTHVMIVRDGRMVEHAPLGRLAGTGAAGRRLVLTLASPDARAPGLLAARPDIANIGAEAPGEIAFDFSGDLSAQAALLRSLLSADLPVAALAERTRNLQDVYLDHLRKA